LYLVKVNERPDILYFSAKCSLEASNNGPIPGFSWNFSAEGINSHPTTRNKRLPIPMSKCQLLSQRDKNRKQELLGKESEDFTTLLT